MTAKAAQDGAVKLAANSNQAPDALKVDIRGPATDTDALLARSEAPLTVSPAQRTLGRRLRDTSAIAARGQLKRKALARGKLGKQDT
jgi:hypothetical protein